MDALLQKLLDAASSAGGKTNYPAFYASLSDEEKRLLPRAIKLGKANGTLKSYLVWNAETKSNEHILERVATP